MSKLNSADVSPIHGTNYWRSLQELADTEEYRHQLENEFPGGIHAPGGMTRRRFLQATGGLAAAALVGQNLGAGHPERTVRAVHSAARMALLVALVGSPRRVFTRSELVGQAFKRTGGLVLHVLSPCNQFCCVQTTN